MRLVAREWRHCEAAAAAVFTVLAPSVVPAGRRLLPTHVPQRTRLLARSLAPAPTEPRPSPAEAYPAR